jgi:hypothetical protein
MQVRKKIKQRSLAAILSPQFINPEQALQTRNSISGNACCFSRKIIAIATISIQANG